MTGKRAWRVPCATVHAERMRQVGERDGGGGMKDMTTATGCAVSRSSACILSGSSLTAHAAHIFSQPDAHPRPFEDPALPWHFSHEGLPVLAGSIGAFACRVVGAAWQLSHRDARNGRRGRGRGAAVGGGRLIARVVRVEQPERLERAGPAQDIPLLYHRKDYTTVGQRKVVQSGI
ncbi:hypothetical protein FA95DRAFT_1344719 [Auriscalpium vulgare]|uniref:Uncharacterized protein n=1 Tax=Auriscalpium vulgare TaxID=40419 RepID=A0ACB8R1P6_9AGAM|nr:hypothetical protein FA95DRAFT_1344719 [Auriscalpium vulgare]